jgi:WD40 repeat protein
VFLLALLPSGSLASSSNDSTVKIWNVKTTELVATLKDQNNNIWYSLAVLSRNDRLVSSSLNEITIWGEKAWLYYYIWFILKYFTFGLFFNIIFS